MISTIPNGSSKATVVLSQNARSDVPGTNLAGIIYLPPETSVPDSEGPLQTTPVARERYLSIVVAFQRHSVPVTLIVDLCERPAAAAIALFLVANASVLGGNMQRREKKSADQPGEKSKSVDQSGES